MQVRKFCLCGVKLERKVADEESARAVVAEFRRAHSGAGHGPADYKNYLKVVSKIVAANHHRKEARRRGLEPPAEPLLRTFRVIRGGKATKVS